MSNPISACDSANKKSLLVPLNGFSQGFLPNLLFVDYTGLSMSASKMDAGTGEIFSMLDSQKVQKFIELFSHLESALSANSGGSENSLLFS